MAAETKFNGRTLDELKELCEGIEEREDLGFDATLGDESEGTGLF